MSLPLTAFSMTLGAQQIRGQQIRGQQIRGQQIRGQQIRGQQIRGQALFDLQSIISGPNLACPQFSIFQISPNFPISPPISYWQTPPDCQLRLRDFNRGSEMPTATGIIKLWV
jgi:hypothetical protein